MSSENKTAKWEPVLLIASMILVACWYAWPQIVYSLFIGYDLGSLFAPQFMEKITSLLGVIP